MENKFFFVFSSIPFFMPAFGFYWAHTAIGERVFSIVMENSFEFVWRQGEAKWVRLCCGVTLITVWNSTSTNGVYMPVVVVSAGVNTTTTTTCGEHNIRRKNKHKVVKVKKERLTRRKKPRKKKKNGPNNGSHDCHVSHSVCQVSFVLLLLVVCKYVCVYRHVGAYECGCHCYCCWLLFRARLPQLDRVVIVVVVVVTATSLGPVRMPS